MPRSFLPRRKAVWFLLLFSLVLGMVVYWFAKHQEPVLIQGKPFSLVFNNSLTNFAAGGSIEPMIVSSQQRIKSTNYAFPPHREDAISASGTNAIPALLRVLRESRTPWNLIYSEIHPHLPKRFKPPRNYSTRQEAALTMLGRIGMELNHWPQTNAAWVLRTHAEAKRLLMSTNVNVRAAAARTLGQMRVNPEETSSLLRKILLDRNEQQTAKYYAILGYGALHPKGKGSLAPLMEIARSSGDSGLKGIALIALSYYLPERKEEIVPFMLEVLEKDPSPETRQWGVNAIITQRLSPADAMEFLPVLEKLVKSKDFDNPNKQWNSSIESALKILRDHK